MLKNKNIKLPIRYYISQLNDIRFIGQICFIVIVLLISWSGVKTIQTNYNLQKQITTLNQQNEIQKLQNDNLALENTYYNSNQFLELSARQNFGLASPGEKEVTVSKQVALAHTIPISNYANIQSPNKTTNHNNINSWVNFFLHKASDN